MSATPSDLSSVESVLFLDNVDSFTFNLVDEFARRGCAVDVWRNDAPAARVLEVLDAMSGPTLCVLSPGPGAPAQAGCALELMRRMPEATPVLGVCLGHQIIVEAFGGAVGRAPEIVHGKTSPITHDGTGIFAGLPSPLKVGRYHSLAAHHLPDTLRATAHIGEVVMAVQHRTRPITGVQFHPESILTRDGGALIEAVMTMAAQAASHPRSQA